MSLSESCYRKRLKLKSQMYSSSERKAGGDRLAPQSSHVLTSSLNIRVADVWAIYGEWKERGADFITEPKEWKFAVIFETRTDT